MTFAVNCPLAPFGRDRAACRAGPRVTAARPGPAPAPIRHPRGREPVRPAVETGHVTPRRGDRGAQAAGLPPVASSTWISYRVDRRTPLIAVRCRGTTDEPLPCGRPTGRAGPVRGVGRTGCCRDGGRRGGGEWSGCDGPLVGSGAGRWSDRGRTMGGGDGWGVVGSVVGPVGRSTVGPVVGRSSGPCGGGRRAVVGAAVGTVVGSRRGRVGSGAGPRRVRVGTPSGPASGRLSVHGRSGVAIRVAAAVGTIRLRWPRKSLEPPRCARTQTRTPRRCKVRGTIGCLRPPRDVNTIRSRRRRLVS